MYQEQEKWSLIILLKKTQGHSKGHFNGDQFCARFYRAAPPRKERIKKTANGQKREQETIKLKKTWPLKRKPDNWMRFLPVLEEL